MVWKKVALAGCVAPAVAGCNIVKLACHNIVNEPLVAHTERAIERDTRRDAKAAWQEVRAQFPRRMFTADFRDGFVDGYVDHLDNGSTPMPPVAAPPRYRGHANDFTASGQSAAADYLRGFVHGAEAAAASQKRNAVLVPMALADPRPEQPLNITCIPAPAPPVRLADPTAPAAPPQHLPVVARITRGARSQRVELIHTLRLPLQQDLQRYLDPLRAAPLYQRAERKVPRRRRATWVTLGRATRAGLRARARASHRRYRTIVLGRRV